MHQLPPIGNRTRSRQVQAQQYRSPRRSFLDSRTSSRATSRASHSTYAGRRSRATSCYSVDSEVWNANRSPAPLSEVSYNMSEAGDDYHSPQPPSYSPRPPSFSPRPSSYSPRPPSHSSQHQQHQQHHEEATRPSFGHYDNQHQEIHPQHISMQQTTIRPAPYQQRLKEQQRQRRLDQRRGNFLEKRRMQEQQKEIQALEKKIKEQERTQRRENNNQYHLSTKKQRGKGVSLLRILRDRHHNEGNHHEVHKLNSVLQRENPKRGNNNKNRSHLFKQRNNHRHRPEKIVLIPNLRDREF